ncbi:hypothetical protein [Alkalisalibacterium limincola]|nr:hypothetical protein [Alkalisalibacterium limincola]
MSSKLDPNQSGQTQPRQPGRESRMDPEPLTIRGDYAASGRSREWWR